MHRRKQFRMISGQIQSGNACNQGNGYNIIRFVRILTLAGIKLDMKKPRAVNNLAIIQKIVALLELLFSIRNAGMPLYDSV